MEAVKATLRFLWLAVRPLPKVIPPVNGLVGVGIALGGPAVAGLVEGSWRAAAIAFVALLTVLVLIAGVRLQMEVDSPIAVEIIDGGGFGVSHEFWPNSPHLVFAVTGEFVHRGRRSLSANFVLRKDDWEISGRSYDDFIRMAERGDASVLPDSLHNPLRLGKPGEPQDNRKGVIGFVIDPRELEARGMTLDDLKTGQLIVTNRFSRREAQQVINLADLHSDSKANPDRT